MNNAFKITIFFLASTICIVLTSLTSCQLSPEKVDATEERLTPTEQKIIKAHYLHVAEVIYFKKAASAGLKANEKIINDYKISIANKSKSYTAEYKEPISVLDRKNCDLKKRISEYKDGGPEKWNSFKKEFSIDMESLGQSLNDSSFAVNN